MSAAVIRSASRHPHLITTIRDAQADVICLAECDHIFAEPALGTAPHGRSCLARSLRANYDAVYRCKVVGAEHGSLVAWRRDRFRLVGACGLRLDDCGDAVETNAAAPEEAAACAARLEAEGEARRLASAEGAAEAGGEAGAAATDGSAAAAKRERAPPARGELPGDALRRGNVGVLAALAPINCDPSESCRLLVVGCTHLWWQPDQPHVNAAQAVMLRDAAELFAAASVAAVAPTAPAGSEVTATTVIAADTNRFPADSAMRILRGDVVPAVPAQLAGSAFAPGAVLAAPSAAPRREAGRGAFSLSLRLRGDGAVAASGAGEGELPSDTDALPVALPFDAGLTSYLLNGEFASAPTPFPPAAPRAYGKAVPKAAPGGRCLEWPHAADGGTGADSAARSAWLRGLEGRIRSFGLLPPPAPLPGTDRREASAVVAAAVAAATRPADAETAATAPGLGRLSDAYVASAAAGAWTAPLSVRLTQAAGRAPHLLEALPRTVLDGLGAPSKRKASKALEQWACKTWADPTGLQLPKAVDLSPAEVDALASRPLFLAPELAPHRGELPDPDPVGAPVATDGPAGYFTNAVPAFSGSLDYILVSGARAAATPGSGPDAPAGEALAGAAGRSAADAGVGLRPAAASGWRVAGAAPLPDAEWALGGLGGMPNAVQASDHLPLLAVLV